MKTERSCGSPGGTLLRLNLRTQNTKDTLVFIGLDRRLEFFPGLTQYLEDPKVLGTLYGARRQPPHLEMLESECLFCARALLEIRHRVRRLEGSSWRGTLGEGPAHHNGLKNTQLCSSLS